MATTGVMLCSLAATVLLLVLLRPLLARLDMIDVPNARSSHSLPVLRGGGLAIALATCLALVLGEADAGALILVPAGFAIVGFADDRKSRTVKIRLAAQVCLATVAAVILVRGLDFEPALFLAAVVAVAFWIVSYVNVFNFMDGINGITGVSSLIAGASYWVLGTQVDSSLVAVGGAALVGSALGFLPFNFPSPRVFAGDTGSYFIGSYIAILVVLALKDGSSPVAVIGPLMVYLADTSYTLIRRAFDRKPLFEAHRDHAYQYLANRRLTHVRTTLLVAAMTTLCAVLGSFAQGRSARIAAGLFAANIVLAVIFVRLPSVFVDRRATPRLPA